MTVADQATAEEPVSGQPDPSAFCINYLGWRFYSSVDLFPFGIDRERQKPVIIIKSRLWPAFLSILAGGQLKFLQNLTIWSLPVSIKAGEIGRQHE